MHSSFSRRPSPRLALAVVIAVLQGCGSSSATPTGGGSITLSLIPTSATVQQGGSTQVTGTVTRNDGFTGAVTISVLNPPAGITGALTGPVAAGSSTGVATLSVASTATVGTETLTVQASGSGVSTVTAQFVLTVTAPPPAGGFTIAGTPPTLSVVQGQSASTGVKATRTNGLSGAIGYTASGAPSGLGVAIAATSVADSSSVTATASATVAAGVYPITITATSGVLTQQATITVTVVPTVALDFSACPAAGKPDWVASQDGGGPWTRVTGTGDVYNVPAFTTGKGALAFVTQSPLGSGTFYTTHVMYLTAGELSGAASCSTPSTGKTVIGSTAGITGTDAAAITLGGSPMAFANATTPAFQVTNVPAGLQDLFAYRSGFNGPSSRDRIIIHRDQNIAAGGTAGLLDFNATEAFAPASATITVTGGAINTYFPMMRYLVGTACAADTLNFNNTQTGSPITMFGIPATQQRATDYHNVVLQHINGELDVRTVATSFHTLADRTVAIGAGVGPVQITTLPASYLRLQAAITLAPDYSSASFDYSTGGATSLEQVIIALSANYLGGTTAITFTPPDLSAVPGYQQAWLPTTTGNLEHDVEVSSTPPATMCSEGATLRTAVSSVGGA